MKTRARLLFALALMSLPTHLIAETRQVAVRTPGRASNVSHVVRQDEIWDGYDGGGCSSGGCTSRGCSSCEAAWGGSCGVASCTSCCPCLLTRIAAGITRTIDCIFTCGDCGGCGGCSSCATPCVTRGHGCCLPGLVSVRHNDGCTSCGPRVSGRVSGGCTSGGCSTGGCTSKVGGGCTSCGSGHHGHTFDSSVADPFRDDVEVAPKAAAPVVPGEARMMRSKTPTKVVAKSTERRAVVEVPGKNASTRSSVQQKSMAQKYVGPKGEPAKTVSVLKSRPTASAAERKSTSVARTSETQTVRKLQPNTLRENKSGTPTLAVRRTNSPKLATRPVEVDDEEADSGDE